MGLITGTSARPSEAPCRPVHARGIGQPSIECTGRVDQV
eukprot:CAMPEP_0179136396 /NCGR_PEP_ID=MMETSP0796-20121207/64994_1 /TAXON_ID=73915 /ORGANISM="Pyrodinium bahamense, Strain pbaha01" /LENGTH=38 /DNA_ID= /DNA_START= /DNA_END= /DNA_ORIENTATION=